MKKYFISACFILFFLLLGCVTTITINSEEAYLAGYFGRLDHFFRLVNLETGEKGLFMGRRGSELSVGSIPAGEWAITSIMAKAEDRYAVEIPLQLQTIITAKPGTVIFLGDFSYVKDKERKLFTPEKGSLIHDYPFNKFVTEYELRFPEVKMELLPLQVLSLED